MHDLVSFQVLVSQRQGPPALASISCVENGDMEIPTESALEDEGQVTLA